MKISKYIPNILTSLRIIGCFLLLCPPALSAGFVFIYILTGITDILDGFLARKLDQASNFGEKYDSIADLLFMAVCLMKILPVLSIELWCWIWIGIIVLIKVINLISGYVVKKKMIFLHTKANKITGFLLFLSPLAMMWFDINYIAAVLFVVATFAVIQEGHVIRSGRIK